MPKYVLHYFNARARGEFIRLLFAAVGAEYQDRRIEREQWPQVKPTMPFYQIPLLEVDGVKICQTSAIGRFIANTYGIAGKTILDQARADMIVECFNDAMGINFRNYVFENDAAKRKEAAEKYAAEQLSASLTALEKMLVENKSGNGYFVGDELTWADIKLLHFYGQLQTMHIDSAVDAHPKLAALVKRVAELPRLKQYISQRPASEW